MNEKIQQILTLVAQSNKFSDEEKNSILKSLKEADKEISIASFKIERLEKVKYTTTVLLEQTIEELEAKRKSAEQQKRELEIEAALERVRTRTMAMQKSDELQETSLELFQQLKELGEPAGQFTIGIINEAENVVEISATLDGKKLEKAFLHSADEPFVMKKVVDAWKAQQKSLIIEQSTEELESYNKFRNELTRSTRFPTRLQAGEKRFVYVALFSKGMLALSTSHPRPNESLELLERFASVFDLTYTRFSDLKQAEAQTRESQIQLALERVRAKTMAMQKHDDLLGVLDLLVEQLTKLGVQLHIANFSDGLSNGDWNLWVHTVIEGAKTSNYVHFPRTEHPFFKRVDEGMERYRKGGFDLTKEVFTKEEKDSWFRYVYSHTVYKEIATDEDKGLVYSLPGYAWSAIFLKDTWVSIARFNTEPFSDEEDVLLRRFAHAFGLAYTRFLDLKKAEQQAREVQVQLALERVRARTMAMQHSDELSETAYILFQQFRQLGEDPIQITIGIFNEERNTIEFKITGGDGSGSKIDQTFHADIDEPMLINKFFRAWKENKKSTVISLEGKELSQWIGYRNKISGKYAHDTEVKSTDRRYAAAGFFSKGLLSISKSQNPSGETIQIIERFASVFDLTYTRFLDLKHAEAQAREAQIEAALERIRSRTLAMQKSNELAETAAVLFRQLILMGIAPNRLYISVVKDENANSEFWITDEDGSKVSSAFEADLNANPTFQKMFNGWKEQRKSLTIDLQGEELQNYFAFLNSIHVPFKGGLSQPRRVQTIAYFSHGFIGLASPNPQPEETVHLLERFASVFNLTFARFNDLKIAEAHAVQAEQDLMQLKAEKKKTEEALANLRATQSQLVQAEKMASLGELTAGIAHEIQNPLNFVNNFAEINIELVDELKDELLKGNSDQASLIAEDLKDNNQKIAFHGKRADSIVKGMLQHSRASSGKKELTDINSLADEFLRLSYHGLRAKDKSFNATMETNFDYNIDKVEIIPQDLGRVLLNLFNNAFYSVNEKKKMVNGLYEPKVFVSTEKLNDKIQIVVKDNGNGIPQKIIEKIYQPFFTTKPTGEGTGLGLSLSYDIITKGHNGELKVETKEGEFAQFRIILPTTV